MNKGMIKRGIIIVIAYVVIFCGVGFAQVVSQIPLITKTNIQKLATEKAIKDSQRSDLGKTEADSVQEAMDKSLDPGAASKQLKK